MKALTNLIVMVGVVMITVGAVMIIEEKKENHCKASGWRLVESLNLDDKTSMTLQSRVATYCIMNQTKHQRKYGLIK